MTPEDEARFWSKVSRTGRHWIWLNAVNSGVKGGYGYFWLDGRTQRVHRLAHELLIGPIPSGYVVDHTCNIRTCVRPMHLEAITQAENIRRRDERRRLAAACRTLSISL